MYKVNISIFETLVNINLAQSQTESRRYYFVYIALHVTCNFINVVIYMYMYLFHKFFKCKLYSLTSPSTETGRKRHNNSMSKYNMRALSKVLLAKNASSEKCKERV